jgi:hypothetical protein
MSYKMNPAQFEQVTGLPAQERYIHFVSKAADWQELWTLKGPNGFVMFGNDSNQECVPVWPHPDYAASLAKDSWSDCSPEQLNLESFMAKWIPGMIKDNRMVAVFPTPQEKGIVIDPQRLRDDLSAELEQYG